jgi:cytochrome c553
LHPRALRSIRFPAAVALASLLAGCPAFDAPTAPSGSSGAGASGAGGSTGAGTQTTGLPCDVANVLETFSCLGCHGPTPSGGATVSLASYQDLTAQSPAYAGQTMAQRAVARMQDATAPMPPGTSPTVPASDVAIVQAWIDAGYPMGSCGSGGSGGGVVGNDPLNAAPQCSSGRIFSSGGGEDGEGQTGPGMDPGQACIGCHAHNEGPRFSLAGTVYPTGHEPNNCIATEPASLGAIVIVTGANGQQITVPVSGSGNFSYGGSIALPYRAKVVDGQGHERAMAAAQTSGDCNACHTPSGANSAPGRVTMPM